MARTLAEIRASSPVIDRAKVRATTEADIARHAQEDGSEPAAPLADFVTRMPGQRGSGKKARKVQLTLRVDPAVVDRWRASGARWHSRIGELIAREAPEPGPGKTARQLRKA